MGLPLYNISMAIIFTSQKCRNQKRKPGWRQAAQQEAEWLKRIHSMRLFSTPVKPSKPLKQVQVSEPLERPKAKYVKMEGTKKVVRPELLYRDNPEMLARELKARERRFNVAPAYNKGPTIFVSEEEITNQLVGGRRR
jgi:hypothetical protein